MLPCFYAPHGNARSDSQFRLGKVGLDTLQEQVAVLRREGAGTSSASGGGILRTCARRVGLCSVGNVSSSGVWSMFFIPFVLSVSSVFSGDLPLPRRRTESRKSLREVKNVNKDFLGNGEAMKLSSQRKICGTGHGLATNGAIGVRQLFDGKR